MVDNTKFLPSVGLAQACPNDCRDDGIEMRRIIEDNNEINGVLIVIVTKGGCCKLFELDAVVMFTVPTF